ncbi:Uma2 family endonuclease [uncultured Clostridium sp.]|uniref:Uma2 family endonuclease n=1 Tax=uncultured Clostridium sp. TaxID=59620 RepID=UPI00260BC0B2|nr:Uma2 family endonuclease [uncultured Clostridium sp.]
MGIQELNILYTLEEFLELEKKSDVPLEFIKGYVYAKSFSSINHNTIVNRINAKVDNYLLNKPCRVFSEQIEVILGKDRVKPDVFVVCKDSEKDKFETLGQSFLTIPTLIFEVVSPSNASLDTITKMEIYAKAGIKEYNLVYQNGEIHQYKLNEYEVYYLNNSYRIDEVYKSIVMDDLEFKLNNIFSGLGL